MLASLLSKNKPGDMLDSQVSPKQNALCSFAFPPVILTSSQYGSGVATRKWFCPLAAETSVANSGAIKPSDSCQ